MSAIKLGFRQQMAWLHTWGGLVSGWLLCAIFLTGTLAVFRQPITQWMEARPLPAASAPPGVAAAAWPAALAYLEQQAPRARFWRLELPGDMGGPLQLFWAGGGQAAVDAVSGAPLPVSTIRATEGGRHFMTFHYQLHADTWGAWLVGALSICMLVALISGTVVHRRIFQDFFTFRTGKGQRSWLDAHNVTAVLALPFLFMITYTGLAFFYTAYMPWPLHTVYGEGNNAHRVYHDELHGHAAPSAAGALNPAPATLQALRPLVLQAEALMDRPARRVFIQRPGGRSTTAMTVRVFGPMEDQHATTIANTLSSVTFDGVTGAVLEVEKPQPEAATSSAEVHEVFKALHLVRFGGWSMKWLYFLGGLMGTAMMATGTIMFCVKRRKKSAQEFGRATAGIYRVVEALNVTSMAGIALACIGYFYANRLLPAELPARALWEIRAFLIIWLLTLLHALAYALTARPARAWIAQLATAAVLCCALPLLNYCTTGQQLFAYAVAGDWQRAGVELVALAFGITLGWAAWRVHGGWRAPSPKVTP